jgi:hypothetical protein
MINIIGNNKIMTNAGLSIFLLVLMLTFTGKTSGQSIDLYFGGGTASFLGDLGGKPTLGTNDPQDLDLESTRFGITAGARINFGKYVALRTDVWYARLAGDDKFTVNRERRDRNLSFFTNIWEGDVLAELNLLRTKNGRGIFYVFGGVGYFYFNPKTKMNGETYELQKYGTEGQYGMPGKSPYALSSICYPNGFGYKWAVGKGQYFAFELNMRKTKTDYIDDVSTRFADPNVLIASKGQISADLADRSNGDVPYLSSPGSIRGHDWNNDSYFFLNITYNITLGVDRNISEFRVRKPVRGGINSKKKCFEF